MQQNLYNLLKVELAEEDRVLVSDEDRAEFKWISLSEFLKEKYSNIIRNFHRQKTKAFYRKKFFEYCKTLGFKTGGIKTISGKIDDVVYISEDFSLVVLDERIVFNNVCTLRFFNYDRIIDLAKQLAAKHQYFIKTWKTLIYENQNRLIKDKIHSLITNNESQTKNGINSDLQDFKAELEGKDSSLQYNLQPLVDYVYQENLKYKKLVNLTEKSIDVMLKNSQRDYNKDCEAIRIKMPGRRYVEFKFDKKNALKTKLFFDKLEELEALLKQMPRTTIKYYGPNMTWQKGENQ